MRNMKTEELTSQPSFAPFADGGARQRSRIPNALSALRILLAPVFMALFWSHTTLALYAAFLCIVLALVTDWWDGYYARRYSAGSDLGKVLDPLADAVFFVTVFGTLGALGCYPAWLAIPFFLREATQHLYVRPAALHYGLAMGAKMIGKVKTGLQGGVSLWVVAVEITRSYSDALIPYLRTDQFFNVLDWISVIAVGITAAVSLASIIPYVRQLSAIQRASGSQ